jgi:hypothetical protein
LGIASRILNIYAKSFITHEDSQNRKTRSTKVKKKVRHTKVSILDILSVCVPIGGRQIAEIFLFILGNRSRVNSGAVTFLVLEPQGHHVECACQTGEANEREADDIPGSEICDAILYNERISSDDSTNIAEANLPCGSYAASMMATQVHGEPAYNDRHGAVTATGDQEKSAKLRTGTVMDCHEHGESGNSDRHWNQGKNESVSQPVRTEGDYH